MKGKPFRDQDNRALHERRMKERTRIVVTQKNIEYILAHQHDSREELARYLRQCKKELGHVPAQSEVIGGDLLALSIWLLGNGPELQRLCGLQRSSPKCAAVGTHSNLSGRIRTSVGASI